MPKKKLETKKSQKTKTIKSEAKTKKGMAQAQTTNVVVKIGEVKKKRSVKKKAKKVVSKPQQLPDGWYPPQNLMRNGAIYSSVLDERYSRGYQPSSFMAGPAITKPSMVETATTSIIPPMQIGPYEPVEPSDVSSYLTEPSENLSGYLEEPPYDYGEASSFNVTDFLKEAKKLKGRQQPEMYEPPLGLREEEQVKYFQPFQPLKEESLFQSYKPDESGFMDMFKQQESYGYQETKEEIPELEETESIYSQPVISTGTRSLLPTASPVEEPVQAYPVEEEELEIEAEEGEEGEEEVPTAPLTVKQKNIRYAKELEKINLINDIKEAEKKLKREGIIDSIAELTDTIYDGKKITMSRYGIDKLKKIRTKLQSVYGV